MNATTLLTNISKSLHSLETKTDSLLMIEKAISTTSANLNIIANKNKSDLEDVQKSIINLATLVQKQQKFVE